MSNHFYYGDNLTVLRESIQMRPWTSSPSPPLQLERGCRGVI